MVSGYQQMNNGQEALLNDAQIGWNNGRFWQGENLIWGQQIRASLPASKDSRVRDEKILGVTVAPSFTYDLTPSGLTGVSLNYIPAVTKNFHKTEQNKAFQNNVSFNTVQAFAVIWSITDKLYLQPMLVYGLSWSYDGYKRDDFFQFETEVGYSIQKNLILAAGVTNQGTIQNFQNGSDQTLQLYNNKTASAYTELTYVF